MSAQHSGEVPGNGYPDWPEWCTTFHERKAYQQGVADARAIAKPTLRALMTAAKTGAALAQEASNLLESLPVETLEAAPLYRWPLCDELGGAALILLDAAK